MAGFGASASGELLNKQARINKMVYNSVKVFWSKDNITYYC
jgi:hypothetical protein